MSDSLFFDRQRTGTAVPAVHPHSRSNRHEWMLVRTYSDLHAKRFVKPGSAREPAASSDER